MPHRSLSRIVSSIAIATLWLLQGLPAASAATPEFRLMPNRGTCTATSQYVAVQSANFAPGHVIVRAKLPRGNSFLQDYVFNGVANPAGTLASRLYVAFCEPTTPDGTVITFEAWERPEPVVPGNIYLGQLLATTTFTVDSAAGPLPILPPLPPSLPNTGQGGMARPPLGLAQSLAAAASGIGIGIGARRRKGARTASTRHG